jgi:hypothetical protein
MLAAGQDRTAAVVPQREQLVLLVRAAVGSRALERLGQQRMRERLAGDPLGVQHVGLAALARAVIPRRTVRAHITHVVAAAGQEHRRVTPPARRALDPPADDRTELPRPRLKRPMPVPRHAEVLASKDPAAGINDRRGQRPLVRIDADHIARMIGRDQHARRSRTTLLRPHHLTSRRNVVGGPADNIPVDAPHRGERSYQVRPILEGKNRGRHFVRKTPLAGEVRSLWSQASVQPSSLRRPSPAQTSLNSTPGSLASSPPKLPPWTRTPRRRAAAGSRRKARPAAPRQRLTRPSHPYQSPIPRRHTAAGAWSINQALSAGADRPTSSW